MSVQVQSVGIGKIFLIVAIVLFLLAAFGVAEKLGINLVDLGLGALAAAFLV